MRGRFDRFDQGVLKVVPQFETRHHIGRRDLIEKGVLYGDTGKDGNIEEILLWSQRSAR